MDKDTKKAAGFVVDKDYHNFSKTLRKKFESKVESLTEEMAKKQIFKNNKETK